MAWDVSDFLSGLKGPARQRIQRALLRSADLFGEHVIGQAQRLAPVKLGTLQNSGTTLPAEIRQMRIIKVVGFNTSYAAAVHERLDVHHNQGQAKFLETPLRTEASKLVPFAESEIKKS